MRSNLARDPIDARRKYLLVHGLVLMAAEVLDDGPADWEVKLNLRNIAEHLKEKCLPSFKVSPSPDSGEISSVG